MATEPREGIWKAVAELERQNYTRSEIAGLLLDVELILQDEHHYSELWGELEEQARDEEEDGS